MAIGKKVWVIPGGCIPLDSNGHEPDFTSRDQLSLLNTGDIEAEIGIFIFHEAQEPVGPYELRLAGRRMRRVRFNDLIFPQALELGSNFAALLLSNVPVVVQFTRVKTSDSNVGLIGTIAHCG